MKNRLEELDILKFWGILLVVLGHVTNMWTPMGIVHPVASSDKIGFISSFVYLFHMPLFVFVSGCVYAYQCERLGKQMSFDDLISKKFKRLLIPYLVFGIFLVALMVGCGFREDILDYAYNGVLLSKDSRHLWFVLMLFEVFIVFWIMSKCVEKTRLPKWNILLISFVIYLLANKLPYILQINNAARYLFWFTLGYEFLTYKSVIHNIIVNYIVMIVILLVCAFYRSSVSVPFMHTIAAMAGIMLFYHISCDFKGITKWKFYHIVSKNSFGIYLYHVFFIYLMFYYLANIPISPYLLCFMVFLLSLVLSIVMTKLTRMLGFYIIIGERKPYAK